jgi:hypothetical protein
MFKNAKPFSLSLPAAGAGLRQAQPERLLSNQHKEITA